MKYKMRETRRGRLVVERFGAGDIIIYKKGVIYKSIPDNLRRLWGNDVEIIKE